MKTFFAAFFGTLFAMVLAGGFLLVAWTQVMKPLYLSEFIAAHKVIGSKDEARRILTETSPNATVADIDEVMDAIYGHKMTQEEANKWRADWEAMRKKLDMR